jgi:DNA-binding transcriptional regulator GbsR (MarR family)
MASHGTVLFYLARHHNATIREIAGATELTERRVSQIIRDLSDTEMLQVERRGRRNVYEINDDATFTNPLNDVRMGTVVDLIRHSDTQHSEA